MSDTTRHTPRAPHAVIDETEHHVGATVRVLGIGSAVPPLSIAQDDAAEAAVGCCADSARRAKLLAELYRQTTVATRGSTLLRSTGEAGVTDADSLRWYYTPRGDASGDASDADKSRVNAQGPTTADRMAHYREAAPALAAEACGVALADADVDADRITHLVVVTCTGFASPGVEAELIQRLGLRHDVTRTHVGFMGCNAALNGLQVARAFAAADPAARVLLVCVELCSLHFQYGWESQRIVANALFADGAGAAVIGATEPAERGDAYAVQADPRAQANPKSEIRNPKWTVADTTSALIPGTTDEMSWHVGDHGFIMTLSPRVPQLIGGHVRGWLESWLTTHGLTLDDIGTWAIHPGGPRIVTAVAEALDLNESRPDVALARDVLQSHGNMSSATLLFILEALIRRDAPRPCVALAFGPGLVSEAALLA
ncbi:MAG: type III polyketide synthase [Phycisphaera sp.]|nr:type III polyketide synthase [Phycisphaera sp.]